MNALLRHGPRSLAAAALGLAAAAVPAGAAELNARYSVSLMGLHVGEISAQGDLEAQNYRVNVTAHLDGLAVILSNVKLALASSGTVRKSGVVAPSTYATSAVSSSETRTLRMALTAGNVKAVEISPPPEYHGERVPVTEANKRNILDPTSALIMPVPLKAELTGPAACERTLPIYDGYARFDISLHYVGTQDVAVPGYSGPVSVCSARYHPISGHLVNSRATAYMAENEGIQVWLAPIERAHVVVPLRVSMPTQAGQVEIEATAFETGQAANQTADTTH